MDFAPYGRDQLLNISMTNELYNEYDTIPHQPHNIRESFSASLLHSSDIISLRDQLKTAIAGKHHRIFLPHERLKMERYESIDTHEPATTVYKDHLESRNQEPRWFIWVFVFGLGIASSIIAITIVSMLHVLNGIRYELLGFGLRGFSFNDPNRYNNSHNNNNNIIINSSSLDIASMFEGAGVGLYGIEPRSYSKGYLMWILFSFITSIISSCICAFVPESIGSGLPEVVAYLNGVHYPMLSSVRVLFAKITSIIFSVASGVCTGHFGSLILTGAMLGAQVLERRRYFRCDSINIIECFRNPRDRRIIIVIGAAAGVASAFSVSIGGLMVVVELISTILPVRFALYVFAASLVSSLTLQTYFSYFAYFSLRDRSSYPAGVLIIEMVQAFVTRVPFENMVRMNIIDFIPAIIIGIICGLLSGIYIWISQMSLVVRRGLEQKMKTKLIRYILPVIFTLIYITINYWVAVAFGSGGWSPKEKLEKELKFQQSKQFYNNSNNNVSNLIFIDEKIYEYQNQESNKSLLSTFSEGMMHGPCVGVPSIMLDTRNVSVIAYYGANGFFCSSPNTNNNINNTTLTDGRDYQMLSVLHSYASLAFANADSIMQTLLSVRTENMFQAPVLIIFLIIYFISSALFLGVGLCGDTLLPGLVIGAVVGRLTGLIIFNIIGNSSNNNNYYYYSNSNYNYISSSSSSWADPGCYALIGAGSFVGGSTGLTFSICTILMECTGDFPHLLPLMMGITIAKKTAELLTRNINAIILESRCVPMLDFENKIHKYPMFDARHVMAPNVITLETVCTIQQILEVLRNTRHNAFPIESVRDRTYKGIIVRHQLEILLWHIYFSNHPSICTYELGKKVEVRLFHDKLLGTMPQLDKQLNFRIDLSPYIDHSGFCVLDTTTLPRTYEMFRTLGLRHLTVVNSSNRIVGIITRKDLIVDRIIEAVTAAEETRRFFKESQHDSSTCIEAITDSNSNTNLNISPSLGNNSKQTNNNNKGNKKGKSKSYEFYYMSEDNMIQGNNNNDNDDEILYMKPSRMHPSASQVAAIKERSLKRKEISNSNHNESGADDSYTIDNNNNNNFISPLLGFRSPLSSIPREIYVQETEVENEIFSK